MGPPVRSLHHGVSVRFVALLAVLCGFWIALSPDLTAQGGITITSPLPDVLLRAGPDFASDIIGDAWDMSNAEDISLDPMQRRGWTSFGFNAGRVGGTLATVDGHTSGSHITFLERAYWGGLKTGRTGARYPIDAGSYTKLSFKMGMSGSGQFPRVYWFLRDLGHPAGTGGGWRYVDTQTASATGDSIAVVNLTQSLGGGDPWSGLIRGFSLYPNSSTVGYPVTFDWIRLTTGDGHPSSAMLPIAWSGGSGPTTIQVIDAANTVMTIASGNVTSPFNWNYGVLPPGPYTLRVTRGASVGNTTFRVNAPPTLQITDPDETGGQDFASAVLGNPWDMSDGADVRAVAQDHLISRSFSGGQFHGISDGVPVATSQDGIPVGDPIVYPLANNGVVNTSRYRYLTVRMAVDGNYDLLRGSVGRVFWGSQAGAAYNLTVSGFFLAWPGMQTYTFDLASLTTGADGGIEPAEGAGVAWTAAGVRYLRIDPHEFAEQRGFHIDDVKLAAMDEPANGAFTIRFAGADADGHPATVALYYDTDRNPSSGLTAITANVPLSTGQYVWNTQGVAAGVYYIYAVASDGLNARGAYLDRAHPGIHPQPADNHRHPCERGHGGAAVSNRGLGTRSSSAGRHRRGLGSSLRLPEPWLGPGRHPSWLDVRTGTSRRGRSVRRSVHQYRLQRGGELAAGRHISDRRVRTQHGVREHAAEFGDGQSHGWPGDEPRPAGRRSGAPAAVHHERLGVRRRRRIGHGRGHDPRLGIPEPRLGGSASVRGSRAVRRKPTRCRRSVWQPIQQLRIQRLSPRPCAKRVSVGRGRAQYRNRNVQSVPIGGGDGSELTRHGARHAVYGKPSPALYGGGMGDRRRLDLRHRR